MGLISQVAKLVKSGSSTARYYESMNQALHQVNDEFTMLHYPFYGNRSDNFRQAQENLTRQCLKHVEPLHGKSVLEIGCGNGVQTKFISEKYKPRYITGIDLNRSNIKIANREKSRRGIENAYFLVDDAQNMQKIKDESFDVVLNIESAFHYPNKLSFLKEVYRTLVPGGKFLIADILTTREPSKKGRKRWKRKMILHHWSLKEYLEGLKKVNLHVEHIEDITEDVIRGFKNYRSWFKQMKKRSLLRTLAFRLFYFINIHLNIFLLTRRRQYLIISGTKPYRT